VKENGIIAGVEVAEKVFSIVDENLKMEIRIHDGEKIKKGDIVFIVSGKVQSILTAERLVLNIMQRMSGIATKTAYYNSLIAGTGARLLDTRKTTPNFRILEKMAVKIGGGCNHRMGLYDMIMLKDNHIDFAGGLKNALEKTNYYLKEKGLNLKIEIETRSIEEVKEALRLGGFFRIMFDNFTPEKVKEAVALVNKRYETEASGNITEETILAYAKTGVDFISVGALTNKAKSLDLSLKAI
jgi:nicotinate-nucleotide pyrophosphorylase (carboxylating)